MGHMHVIRQGECLATIAASYGFRRWQTVYDAPENADFRARRPNPNVVYPGDELFIPDPGAKDESAPTEQRHTFRVPNPRWYVRIQMKDEHLSPLAGVNYVLFVGDEKVVEGMTDEGGLIECRVPASARSGRLVCYGEVIPLNFGHLDPVTRITGVQQRLNNLGLGAGPVDGIVGPLTTRAVTRFQTIHPDLEVTGVIDDATRRALLESHDEDDRAGEAEDDFSERQVEQTVSGADPGPCGFDDAALLADVDDENPEYRSELS